MAENTGEKLANQAKGKNFIGDGGSLLYVYAYTC